jgi:hypothetical protein
MDAGNHRPAGLTEVDKLPVVLEIVTLSYQEQKLFQLAFGVEELVAESHFSCEAKCLCQLWLDLARLIRKRPNMPS